MSQADIARRIQLWQITRATGHHVKGAPYKYKHGWIPVGGVKVALIDLSDDELLDHFHEISQQTKPNQTSLTAIYTELERREKEAAVKTAIDRQVDKLLAKGHDYLSAYAEAHGLSEDQLRREELLAKVDAQRMPGETRERATRRLYDEVTELNYFQAESWTNGHLLNPAGKAAGISPRSLFSGQRARVRKYASEELKRFWAEVTPRQNYTEFRAATLGRPSDLAVAAVSSLAGNGKDFGL